MNIKITGSITYPIESYVSDLLSLVDEIKNRHLTIYKVPYDEIDGINFTLSENPDEDIAIFNNKYAYVQSYISRLAYILIQLKKELRVWNSIIGRLNVLYKKARNLLLINKPDIKSLRNKELQEAAIQNELSDLVSLIDEVNLIIDELNYDYDIVMIKKDTLDRANLNLNRQQKIVEDEMLLNGILNVKGKSVKVNI